jgi:hypothetical protein
MPGHRWDAELAPHTLDPRTLPDRLTAVGFSQVAVERGEFDFRFHAFKLSA